MNSFFSNSHFYRLFYSINHFLLLCIFMFIVALIKREIKFGIPLILKTILVQIVCLAFGFVRSTFNKVTNYQKNSSENSYKY